MGNGLIKCDLTLENYFVYGNAATVVNKTVLPRREGQPILMRGEMGIKDDGNLRSMVAHNTTHVDMPLHFIADTADLHHVVEQSELSHQLPHARPRSRCLHMARPSILSRTRRGALLRTRDGRDAAAAGRIAGTTTPWCCSPVLVP